MHVTFFIEQDPTPHERDSHLPLGLSAGFSEKFGPVTEHLYGPRLPTGILDMSKAEANVRDCMSPGQMYVGASSLNPAA